MWLRRQGPVSRLTRDGALSENPLAITGYPDTKPEMTQQYAACVRFMAAWLAQQDGADGKGTRELFDEFKSQVCIVMKGDPGGSA